MARRVLLIAMGSRLTLWQQFHSGWSEDAPHVSLTFGNPFSRSSQYARVMSTRLRVIAGRCTDSTCLSHYLGPPIVALLEVRKLHVGVTLADPMGSSVARRADLLPHLGHIDAHEGRFHADSSFLRIFAAEVVGGNLADVVENGPIVVGSGDVCDNYCSRWHLVN